MGLERQMRRAATMTTAALGVALLAGGPAPTRAAGLDGQDVGAQSASDNTPHNITLEIVDAKFTTAINLIKNRTGIQIVLLDGDKITGKVNLSLKDRSVSDVLRLVAASAGADIWEKDGIYYLGPKGSAPKPDPVAVLPQPFTEQDPTEWRLEKIHLQYITPAALLRYLGIDRQGEPDVLEQIRLAGLKEIAGIDAPDGSPRPFANSGPVFLGTNNGNSGNAVIPAAPTTGTSTRTAPLSNLLPSNISNANGDQGARRDQGDNGDEFARGQFGGGGGFGGQGGGGFGGGGGGFGGQGGGGFGGGGGQGGLGGAGGGAGGQGGAGQGAILLPPGLIPGDIFALDADGSLLLRYTTPLQLKQFRQLIQLLDVKPKQILIRAQFVTTTQDDVDSFGVTWNFSKVNLVAAANAGFSTTSTAFIQYAIGNLQTQLSWILTTGHGKLVDAPMATTLNALPAVFNNVIEEPVLTQNPIIGINGNVVLSTTISIIPVTVGLAITPYINGDDSLTVVGRVVDSDITGTVTNPAGGSIPIVTTQTAQITRVIRNGDTMVISGLTRKNDAVSTNRVPLLGDLPIIGTLFRSRNVTTDDAELLVFVTPEIIPERPSNGTGTTVVGGAAAGGAGLLP